MLFIQANAQKLPKHCSYVHYLIKIAIATKPAILVPVIIFPGNCMFMVTQVMKLLQQVTSKHMNYIVILTQLTL